MQFLLFPRRSNIFVVNIKIFCGRWTCAEPAGVGGAAAVHARPRLPRRTAGQLPLLREDERGLLPLRAPALRYPLLQYFLPHLDHGG